MATDATAAAVYRDGTWQSPDGLSLHYSDYPGDPAKTPALCVPGLTRNARDFANLAERLAGTRRVVVAELRGRGESEWASDPMTYQPPVYVGDIRALIAQAGLGKVALIGTSLGGIVAMLLSAVDPACLAGVLLNDIGPAIDPDGLARIATYVSHNKVWPDWESAAAGQAKVHAIAYPDYGPADWMAMAKRVARETPEGIILDYDKAIAKPFSLPPPNPAPDPWPLMNGFKGLPGLLVHGALSDILTAETAQRMVATLPEMELLTVPRIGHAPTLDEPECGPAIDRLLARIDAARG